MRAKYRSMMTFAVLSAGTALQTGACSPRALVNFGRNFNPCGTVLECDPVLFNFIRSDYQGPGVDLESDLFCTFPPLCTNDPLIGATNP